jgi:hypothetical protein
LLCLVPAIAPAQVVINQAALLQLAGISPLVAVPAPASHAVVRHFAKRLVFHRRPPAPTAVAMILAPGSAVHAPPPSHPASAQPAVIRPAPLPPLQPVALQFAAGSATLPSNALAALKPICARATGFISINATAPGNPTDPSVAMRLSMARAFAVRDALTACGIPGTQILPRALGSVPGKDENITQVIGGARN